MFLVMMIGGDKRDRTADLLRARQALSQLSYIPNHILWLSLTHSAFNTLNTRLFKNSSTKLTSLSGGSEWT